MASTARQNKPAKRGGADPGRRAPAWTGARASPTFSPSNTPRPQNNQPQNNAPNFPSLSQSNSGGRLDPARDRLLQSLAGLTGTTVTLSTKTGQRYEGVVCSTAPEGDMAGVSLKDVKEISTPGAPLKDSLFIASTNIDTWSSGPADSKPTNGDSTTKTAFQTDVEISGKKVPGRERELQAWVSDGPASDETFGDLNGSGKAWDQFAANEQLFGVKATFDENVYTTPLNRDAPDFKERERKATQIAKDIMGTATNNPHIAEERGLVVDDSGANEEDKYGAVIRGANAYVPPGARRGGVPAGPAGPGKPEVPKVSVNGPDGASVAPPKLPSPIPGNAAAVPPKQEPADPVPAFREFVSNEKQRLTQKRQALVKNEMDKRMAELVKFSQSFKLNKPIPDDLVPILAKDEEKQKAIREKAEKDAASAHARAIGASTPAVASRGVLPGQKLAAKPNAALPTSKTLAGNLSQTSSSSAVSKSNAAASSSSTAVPSTKSNDAAPAPKKVSMVIQAIPPFRGGKAKATSPAAAAAAPSSSNGSAPMSPAVIATAANRLNVNAPSFKVKTAASPASASASPKPKPAEPVTPNPFFGTRLIRKSPPVNIKDDFNPFKHNKVADASQIPATWPYNGKRYMLMYPPPQHPPGPHAPHMAAPPVPSPMPPPSYEEDQAAAASARGYVYAYPQYYPGQPMMAGMPPPPPGFMPGPYMQHMPYPPGMPPPNAMYSPGMAHMPPPGAYMQPPPGAYPPPNGAGPRPSMPPTPMPAHAHYYQQSPQMQHAVPYPMMMPPPPQGGPPHPYDGSAPPAQVPMGGHA